MAVCAIHYRVDSVRCWDVHSLSRKPHCSSEKLRSIHNLFADRDGLLDSGVDSVRGCSHENDRSTPRETIAENPQKNNHSFDLAIRLFNSSKWSVAVVAIINFTNIRVYHSRTFRKLVSQLVWSTSKL